ncbi:MarR family transcriptional regulator [Streptomyces sp. NPDC050204]|uniref:MarR family transcriptional regulator n=1 Tax=Streptomyces sp. NPDC050204 TaxID=3155514 RepID=UPI003438A10D
MTKEANTPRAGGESPKPASQNEVWGYAQVAEAIGVAVGTVRYYWSQKRHLLPTPDVMLGTKPGWYPDTVKEWAANRPGQGFRTDLKGTDS